ncbi:MAG TPA: hypothetical protein VFH43_02465 [Candidatus Kapabacteria bacterium]|jgi:hypothetical protein|nr:hypothetical protein [Candidatus Kapabacteria bacterium]
MMRRNLAIAVLAILAASFNYEASAEPRGVSLKSAAMGPANTRFQSNSGLKEQVKKLTEALNKRDLDVIKSQIAPSRIYVEVSDKAGAYLSNSQTLVVMETFLRSRTAVNAAFEFISDDGVIGSASGSLTARKDGRLIRYRLNFGFVKQDKGSWHLNRISMR